MTIVPWEGRRRGRDIPEMCDRPDVELEIAPIFAFSAWLGRPGAARLARRLGLDREQEISGEEQIPLDSHAEGQPDLAQRTQAPRAELGIADIGKAEHDVPLPVQFGGEPDACAERVEEFHDGDVIQIALAAIAQQAVAFRSGQEDRAAALPSAAAGSSSAASSAGRCDRSQSAALLACEDDGTIVLAQHF